MYAVHTCSFPIHISTVSVATFLDLTPPMTSILRESTISSWAEAMAELVRAHALTSLAHDYHYMQNTTCSTGGLLGTRGICPLFEKTFPPSPPWIYTCRLWHFVHTSIACSLPLPNMSIQSILPPSQLDCSCISERKTVIHVHTHTHDLSWLLADPYSRCPGPYQQAVCPLVSPTTEVALLQSAAVAGIQSTPQALSSSQTSTIAWCSLTAS